MIVKYSEGNKGDFAGTLLLCKYCHSK